MARSERSTPSLFTRHAARGGLVALAALLTACASLLGIEELSPDPDPAKGGAGQAGSATGATGGKAGSTGSGGAAGTPGGRGGSSGASGSAGAAARAGSSSGGSAGAGGGGNGGNGGNGGSNGGSAGSGGTVAGSGGEGGMPPETGPVTGTIIDFWRHPVANIPVRIGDATATTDASGKFTIDDVAATYDAALVVTLSSPAKVYEWVYVGLSRRDPTLQVTEALPSYEAIFSVSQVNGGDTFAEGLWMVGFGSENGSESDSANSAGFYRRPYWWGPAVNDWTVHSIFLERTGDLPSKYVAYETQSATTNSSNPAEQVFEMDLSQQVFDTGNVTGAIDEDTGVGRTNSVFVRFNSGGNVPLVDRVATSASSYQYLVPTLANGSITIAAAETHDDDSYTIAHRDGRNIDDTGVNIVIPPPVSGLAPLNDATGVGPDTVFSFAEGDPDNSGYLVHIESEDYQQGVFIVTANRQFKLSDVPLVTVNLIVPNGWHSWTVQTHGQFDSVDEMAGPTGYLDAFSLDYYRPQGASHSSGAFTESHMPYFQAAPAP